MWIHLFTSLRQLRLPSSSPCSVLLLNSVDQSLTSFSSSMKVGPASLLFRFPPLHFDATKVSKSKIHGFRLMALLIVSYNVNNYDFVYFRSERSQGRHLLLLPHNKKRTKGYSQKPFRWTPSKMTPSTAWINQFLPNVVNYCDHGWLISCPITTIK